MRCTSPRTVGFGPDGKTLVWSQKQISKEYASFQLPCSKCLACRLEYGRSWAVRCIHEAQMHKANCFITLTYSDENLQSSELQYIDFQLFMKRLRDHVFQKFLRSFGKSNYYELSKPDRKKAFEPYKIGCFVTGEYGDKTKRPHWHAIIFNWEPDDLVAYRCNELGDQISTSKTLDNLWGKNDSEKRPNEVGAVTFRSAGYVARYAAKKLTHGYDGTHSYEPISKKSSHQAIGKKWLERYWRDAFNYGFIVLPDGNRTSIPRYYEKWLKINQPEAWLCYISTAKQKNIISAQSKNKKDQEVYWNNPNHYSLLHPNPLPRNEVRKIILESRFSQLQNNLKL